MKEMRDVDEQVEVLLLIIYYKNICVSNNYIYICVSNNYIYKLSACLFGYMNLIVRLKNHKTISQLRRKIDSILITNNFDEANRRVTEAYSLLDRLRDKIHENDLYKFVSRLLRTEAKLDDYHFLGYID